MSPNAHKSIPHAHKIPRLGNYYSQLGKSRCPFAFLSKYVATRVLLNTNIHSVHPLSIFRLCLQHTLPVNLFGIAWSRWLKISTWTRTRCIPRFIPALSSCKRNSCESSIPINHCQGTNIPMDVRAYALQRENPMQTESRLSQCPRGVGL